MLITCPECNNKVSDQSEICIHCGFPLKFEIKKSENNICIIDGISRNLTEQFENISNPSYKPLYKFGHEYGMSIADASMLHQLIKVFMFVPKEYNSSQRNLYRSMLDKKLSQTQPVNIPKCPVCQSTNLSKISTTKKVMKVAAFGIFGMGDNGKAWICNNCGSKF